MSATVYQLALPMLARLLDNTAHVLDLAASHAIQQGLPPQSLATARLAPDMLPLAIQVQILADGCRGAMARLAGRAIPVADAAEFAVFNRADPARFAAPDADFTALRTRIDAARRYLADIDTAELADADGRAICLVQPGQQRHFAAQAFLLAYVLPNAYFHLSMVYAILRQAGVPLGKQDYEGLPVYRLETGDAVGAPC